MTHDGKSYRTSPHQQPLCATVMSLKSVVIIITVKAATIHLFWFTLNPLSNVESFFLPKHFCHSVGNISFLQIRNSIAKETVISITNVFCQYIGVEFHDATLGYNIMILELLSNVRFNQ